MAHEHIARTFTFPCVLLITVLLSCGESPNKQSHTMVVDVHNDVLSGAVLKGYDVSTHLDTGNTDLVRLKSGGVGLQVFAVFGDQRYTGKKGFDYASRQIDSLYSIAQRHHDKIGVAHTVPEAREIVAQGKIAGMIGLEGGHMIGENLDNLDSLAKRGLVYMTLTWNNSNTWATSSADEEDVDKKLEWKGLTDFGKAVIARMNELGIAVDLSHVGMQTFYDTIEASKLPVLASHSNARSLCDVHRNLTANQIKAIANTGGVVCVTFYAPFLDDTYGERIEQAMELHPEVVDSLKAAGVDTKDQLIAAFLSARPLVGDELRPPISRVVDHIDHIVAVAGIDHVGIGADYFGLSTFPYPKGMHDVTGYPLLAQALADRGYTEEEVNKILGMNVLRVLDENIQAKYDK
ncbi:dipeptidase [Parapedobacter tibetensis]|uniref:dipeptidase n=1 Tax=Parapedobacter tibetensis TaxID=2972951 RepID=UPI00214D6765|nr:dipeptidase [Parapedobacter tibetensis]